MHQRSALKKTHKNCTDGQTKQKQSTRRKSEQAEKQQSSAAGFIETGKEAIKP
jgi:hypothetical protein